MCIRDRLFFLFGNCHRPNLPRFSVFVDCDHRKHRCQSQDSIIIFLDVYKRQGLERLACVMQGVGNLFEVDTIKNIMGKICEIARVEYGKDYKQDVSLRVITDHIRSTVFLVSDGVLPSNEGRGYVLRRLLRRAARHGKLLNIEGAFLCEAAQTVIEESKNAYPELIEKRDYIMKVIRIEEENFDRTINQGLELLNGYLADIEQQQKKELSGEMAFKLYDTFGFPIDLTKEIAEEKGISIDEEGFCLLYTSLWK